MTGATAVFTICSNNYLPAAKVLLASVKTHHPDFHLFICLADELLTSGSVYEAGLYDGPFEVVPGSELGIPDYRHFAFGYSIMEFNTALKPFMVDFLLEKAFDRVIYFDPDILLLAKLDAVVDAFDGGATFILTPHLHGPADDDADPNDIAFLQAGAYNCGFVAVRACEESRRIVYWWMRRLHRQCLDAKQQGLFVDQKFMDLVPGFDPAVRVLHDPALNLAYWNLKQVVLEKQGEAWFVNGVPLVFFHFSGFDPRRPGTLSKYTPLFRTEMPAALTALLEMYSGLLIKEGYGSIPDGLYAFGRFSSGTPVAAQVREMFRETTPDWFSDPFDTYEAYLHAAFPVGSRDSRSLLFTNFQAHLWSKEPNQRFVRDPAETGALRDLTTWYVQLGGEERSLDPRMIEPVALRLGAKTADLTKVRPASASEADVSIIEIMPTPEGQHTIGSVIMSALRTSSLRVDRFDFDPTELQEGRRPRGLPPGRVQIFTDLTSGGLYALSFQSAHGYRIGIPREWPLEEFPHQWLTALAGFDEVWAPTRWMQRMLAGHLDRPVLHMPLAVFTPAPARADRKRFGLDPDRFLFHCASDPAGFVNHNHTTDAIEAFRRLRHQLRSRNDESRIGLVIDVGDKGLAARLRQVAEGDPDILVVRHEANDDRLAVLQMCDCFLYLHRHEGMGVRVAEAMALRVPVVATDYGATTELLTPDRGFPIAFKRVPVPEDVEAAAQGQSWAEPDIQHAAWMMARVMADRPDAAQRAERAHDFIQQNRSLQATADRYLARLHVLLNSGSDR